MANSLKEWVCKVFTQENQNARFVELIGVEDEASDLDDWLSQLEGEVEIHT